VTAAAKMPIRQFCQIHGCSGAGSDLLAELLWDGNEAAHDLVLGNAEQLASHAGVARIHQIAEIGFAKRDHAVERHNDFLEAMHLLQPAYACACRKPRTE
jgi:hypothetical protein